jgi:hypothetical protein
LLAALQDSIFCVALCPGKRYAYSRKQKSCVCALNDFIIIIENISICEYLYFTPAIWTLITLLFPFTNAFHVENMLACWHFSAFSI